MPVISSHRFRWGRTLVVAGILAAAGGAAPALAQSGLKSLLGIEVAQAGRADPSAPVIGRSEWDQPFDASGAPSSYLDQAQSSDGRAPLLSSETVPAMIAAIGQYELIVSQGGWPEIAGGAPLKVGMRDPRVQALRARLIASGDLQQSLGTANVFDSYVENAVRHFQSRNGLRPDGVVRDETLSALNVPATDRLQQLRLNVERVEEYSKKLPDRYVMVNIPAAEIEGVQDGAVVTRHNAIVGRPERQTPILVSKVHELNFSPYWHVPESIVVRDVMPAMQRDPEYLSKNLIRAYDADNNEVDVHSIDWTNSEDALRYQYRQDPGEDINSMGAIKINFYNKHAVFLHDTPQKRLFGQNFRAYSSGCVRVQNVEQLVTWLLQSNKDEEWSRQRVDAVIASGERIDVPIKKPVPIMTVYVTAWAQPDGTVQFRRDLYERDGVGPLAANY